MTRNGDANDVVVVGARCPGAATAMPLGCLGYRVVVVERGRVPSDTLSTHGITRGGVVQLARWGLLDRVLASGTPAVRQVVFRAGDDEQIRTITPRDGVDHLVRAAALPSRRQPRPRAESPAASLSVTYVDGVSWIRRVHCR